MGTSKSKPDSEYDGKTPPPPPIGRSQRLKQMASTLRDSWTGGSSGGCVLPIELIQIICEFAVPPIQSWNSKLEYDSKQRLKFSPPLPADTDTTSTGTGNGDECMTVTVDSEPHSDWYRVWGALPFSMTEHSSFAVRIDHARARSSPPVPVPDFDLSAQMMIGMSRAPAQPPTAKQYMALDPSEYGATQASVYGVYASTQYGGSNRDLRIVSNLLRECEAPFQAGSEYLTVTKPGSRGEEHWEPHTTATELYAKRYARELKTGRPLENGFVRPRAIVGVVFDPESRAVTVYIDQSHIIPKVHVTWEKSSVKERAQLHRAWNDKPLPAWTIPLPDSAAGCGCGDGGEREEWYPYIAFSSHDISMTLIPDWRPPPPPPQH